MTVPTEPVREGSRWRYKKPTGEEVGEWFGTQPLDDGMAHEDFVSGVVIIPASEKVKVQVERNGRAATEDVYEMTYTPYVRVDTRIAYFRKLAASRSQIAVIEPVAVPRMQAGEAYNVNLPDGYWWHIVKTGEAQGAFVRYLCCTMRVALYREEDYFADPEVAHASGVRSYREIKPTREGRATKQVVARGDDVNALAKAETGAVGRALGMAGVLVIGTGLATAEDMAELRGGDAASAPTLPESVQGAETVEQVNERLVHLQGEMASNAPEKWAEFSAWWTERQRSEGWASLNDAPLEVRRGMVRRMESMLKDGFGVGVAQHDSSRGIEEAQN